MCSMRYLSWLAFVVPFAIAVAAGAEEPPDSEEAARLRAFRLHAGEAAAAYEIRAGEDRERKLVLRDAPILQWTNPVGMRKAKGDVFLWTDRGRPEVVLSIYEMTDPSGSEFYEDREFSSLSLGPLTVSGPDHEEWRPSLPGVLLKPLPDAGPPVASRTLRLRQMRRLAERFTADKTTRDGVERELRVLPQPVYRYEGDHPDLLDAALFAFVEATDPEVFLLLEARPTDRGDQWHYALARMTSVGLRVYDRGEKVWDALRFDSAPGELDPQAPYAVFKAP